MSDGEKLEYSAKSAVAVPTSSTSGWCCPRTTRFTGAAWLPEDTGRLIRSADASGVVFDPPYKLSGTNQLEEFDPAYGISPVRSRTAIYGLIAGGIAEAARIATDFVLVKCQDQVSSGALRMEATVAYDIARAMELTWADEFWLPGGGLPQDAERGQYHARHNRSVLMVFAAPKANNRRKKLLQEQYRIHRSREL